MSAGEVFYQASVSLVNATKGYRIYDSDWERVEDDDLGRVYKNSVAEYGRCTGRVYRDDPLTKEAKPVGWVFVKRRKYDDADRIARKEDRTYLQEAWVTYRKVRRDDNALGRGIVRA